MQSFLRQKKTWWYWTHCWSSCQARSIFSMASLYLHLQLASGLGAIWPAICWCSWSDPQSALERPGSPSLRNHSLSTRLWVLALGWLSSETSVPFQTYPCSPWLSLWFALSLSTPSWSILYISSTASSSSSAQPRIHHIIFSWLQDGALLQKQYRHLAVWSPFPDSRYKHCLLLLLASLTVCPC